jgi:hypothetical protein
MGQENGHVNLVEGPPSSASAATEGQQLGSLLNAPLPVSSWTQGAGLSYYVHVAEAVLLFFGSSVGKTFFFGLY